MFQTIQDAVQTAKHVRDKNNMNMAKELEKECQSRIRRKYAEKEFT